MRKSLKDAVVHSKGGNKCNRVDQTWRLATCVGWRAVPHDVLWRLHISGRISVNQAESGAAVSALRTLETCSTQQSAESLLVNWQSVFNACRWVPLLTCADFPSPIPPSPLIEDVSVAAICCSVALLNVFPSQSLETPLHSSLNLPAADSDMVAHNKTSGHKSAIKVSFHKHPFIPFIIKSCSPLFPPSELFCVVLSSSCSAHASRHVVWFSFYNVIKLRVPARRDGALGFQNFAGKVGTTCMLTPCLLAVLQLGVQTPQNVRQRIYVFGNYW